MIEFAKRLKRERNFSGLTQKQMAELLNIPLRRYEAYEALGTHNRTPDIELIAKMAEVLDISTDVLLGRR